MPVTQTTAAAAARPDSRIRNLAGSLVVSRGSVSGVRRGGVRGGLTFIELILAIALMSTLFTIGWSISNSFLGVKKIRNHEVAVALANQAIEAARAARYRETGINRDGRKDTLLHDFNSVGGIFDGEKGEGFVPVVKVGGIEFKRDVQIVEAKSLMDGIPAGLKLVRVTVQWKAAEDGVPLTFEAVSALADR